MSSDDQQQDSIPHSESTVASEGDLKHGDDSDDGNSDVENMDFNSHKWDGDGVHLAYVVHGVPVIADLVIEGKPFLRLQARPKSLCTLFKVNNRRYWSINKTPTYKKLTAELYKSRSAKHGRNCWAVSKDRTPIEKTLTVTVDGVRLRITTDKKRCLAMRMSPQSLEWLVQSLKADVDAGHFFGSPTTDQSKLFDADELQELTDWGITWQPSKNRLKVGTTYIQVNFKDLKKGKSLDEIKEEVIAKARDEAETHSHEVEETTDS